MIPDWMTLNEDKPGVVTVDPDGFYPAILDELKAHASVPFDGTVDQFWLEVAHNFMKLDVQFALVSEKKDPRPEHTLVINVSGTGDYKAKWAQKDKPEGRYGELREQHGADADKAAAREAREYYKAVRGFLPQ